LKTHHGDGIIEEHFGQLTVSKGKSPETEITCCVTDGTKRVFNSFDHTVDENFTESVLFGTSSWQLLHEKFFVLSDLWGLKSLMAINLGGSTTMGEFPPVWLNEKHKGNGDQSNDEQEDLNLLLDSFALNEFCFSWILWFTHVDEHSNHELNDSWSLLSLGIPVGKPFDDDHGVHETEEGHQ